MDKNEYYCSKVKEFNDAHRADWHPANNHREKNWPSVQELQKTQNLVYPQGFSDFPLVRMGWQYCRSCFDIIARITCDDCLWGKETSAECSHLARQPQANPTREYCDWCYYQFYLYVLSRKRDQQNKRTCEKCQKTSNNRIITYQNDTIMIICDSCQQERIAEFGNTILNAARNQMERELFEASDWEAYE